MWFPPAKLCGFPPPDIFTCVCDVFIQSVMQTVSCTIPWQRNCFISLCLLIRGIRVWFPPAANLPATAHACSLFVYTCLVTFFYKVLFKPTATPHQRNKTASYLYVYSSEDSVFGFFLPASCQKQLNRMAHSLLPHFYTSSRRFYTQC